MKLFIFDSNSFDIRMRPTLPHWMKQASIQGHYVSIVGNVYSAEQAAIIQKTYARFGVRSWAFADGMTFPILPNPSSLNWVIGRNKYEEIHFITADVKHYPAGYAIGAICHHANEFFATKEDFLKEEDDEGRG